MNNEHLPQTHSKGNVPTAAIYDEAARIPDRVFMDAHAIAVSGEGSAQSVYDEILVKPSDEWARRLAVQVVEAQNTLELLHGHGPAEVVWETDLREYASRGKVTMPYSADCAVCDKVHRAEKLREDNDG